jgi:hypothetical protein
VLIGKVEQNKTIAKKGVDLHGQGQRRHFARHDPFLVCQSVRLLPALCPDDLQFPGLKHQFKFKLFVFFFYDGTLHLNVVVSTLPVLTTPTHDYIHYILVPTMQTFPGNYPTKEH